MKQNLNKNINADMIKKYNKLSREEEISLHGKQIGFKTNIVKSKKIFKREKYNYEDK